MPSVAIRGLMFCNKGQAVNQTKSIWRPFHKPKWWDVFKQTQQNTFTAMDLFKGILNILIMILCMAVAKPARLLVMQMQI